MNLEHRTQVLALWATRRHLDGHRVTGHLGGLLAATVATAHRHHRARPYVLLGVLDGLRWAAVFGLVLAAALALVLWGGRP